MKEKNVMSFTSVQDWISALGRTQQVILSIRKTNKEVMCIGEEDYV